MNEGNARFSDELLADLHAGVLDPDVAAELWPQVNADPAARAVIDALDRVTSTLSSFGSVGLSHSGDSMPADVAARLDTLFGDPPATESGAAESHSGEAPSGGHVIPLRPTSPRRSGVRWQWLAAACALVAAVGAASIWATSERRTDDHVQAQPPSRTTVTPLVLGDDLSANTLMAAMGHHDAPGTLSTDQGLRACLLAIGIDRTPLGSTPVQYRGLPGVLVLAAGPEKGGITAVIVNPDCSPGDSTVYARRDI